MYDGEEVGLLAFHFMDNGKANRTQDLFEFIQYCPHIN